MAVTAAGTQAQTQTQVPPGGVTRFHRDRREVEPAVVNIRTTATVPVRGGPGGGNDPYELFRWFFGPDFQPPGPAPGQRRKQPQPQPEERTIPRGVGRASSSRPMATS